MDKVMDMTKAISVAIEDGQTIYLGGFTHLIPFAAGHEIIRQGYQNLTLARATPDLIFDQMIAAGCASKLIFSWAGNPGVGSLRGFRRAFEDGVPCGISIDEYSHFGLISRLEAGARDLPFLPLRTFVGSDYPEHIDAIRTVENPYGEEPGEIPVVPPLKPDVAVVRAQRADEFGSAQLWGIVGEMVEAAFAADTVVLSVEEIVDTDVIRSDPNRTLIPDTVVDYVVEEPYGSHPSYAQGYYDRDNQAYLDWDQQTETHESTVDWLDEWVMGVEDRTEYLEKLDTERFAGLQPRSNYATPIDMGEY
ncbi:CoA-transferase [Haladaptatus sp. DYF46]|uniref:CoA transferase subunit A n=1 Tax=Haladaptatus sp. DYF46 TaxID=2886041 RepID=UPI001E34F3A9|nr:CoA-transferase [Haladaptatus sp. DYF46]